MRKKVKEVRIGNCVLGGDYPIAIQSMTNTDTRNYEHTAMQIVKLATAGCTLVRVAVPDRESALVLKRLVATAPVPIIADIHFDYQLALLSFEYGAAKIRINPGNIGGPKRIEAVVRAAKAHGAAIRLGVNSGSLPKDILLKHGGPTAPALVDAAVSYLNPILEMGFEQVVLSLKSSDVQRTIEAYRLMSDLTDFPLHLGVTEAGTTEKGTIRSAVGIGALLAMGIGSTLRVSLTADPLQEVEVAKEILSCLGLAAKRLHIISCPTCARTSGDLITMAEEVERSLQEFNDVPLKVAIMGCSVNGPGEAREADVGLALGKEQAVLFLRGKPVERIALDAAVGRLVSCVRDLAVNSGE